mmetsp:Transcript_66366/g.144638  ORF Transcript_66366/g.144638 Transcript_66366/m.144638 type:complete len:243 (+) Transcript_66366:439-1167(+)
MKAALHVLHDQATAPIVCTIRGSLGRSLRLAKEVHSTSSLILESIHEEKPQSTTLCKNGFEEVLDPRYTFSLLLHAIKRTIAKPLTKLLPTVWARHFGLLLPSGSNCHRIAQLLLQIGSVLLWLHLHSRLICGLHLQDYTLYIRSLHGHIFRYIASAVCSTLGGSADFRSAALGSLGAPDALADRRNLAKHLIQQTIEICSPNCRFRICLYAISPCTCTESAQETSCRRFSWRYLSLSSSFL